MEEQLTLFETAKLAKEKGFNWKTHDIWMFGIPPWKDDDYCFDKEWYRRKRDYLCDIPYHEPWYYSPTQGHLQKWLREVYQIEVSVKIFYSPQLNNEGSFKYWGMYITKSCVGDCDKATECKDKYEDAFEEALVLALNLIK
jgi:hypothetical protein